MPRDNFILATDSYKLGHHSQYPKGTEAVYSYFESRPGAHYPHTVFFGLQHILYNQLAGEVVTRDSIEQAAVLAKAHFGNDALFNREGWEYILREHKGTLPVRIKAVPEGTVVPTGNVLMTVENTDPNCYWLTNAIESLLVHVWYPSTVATKSRWVKGELKVFLEETADSIDGLPFMLHDFGYRSATTHDAAAIGGAGHLVNFRGTDTLPAMLLALYDYGANLDELAFSVPATEHSVMTALGREGEFEIVNQLLHDHPTGILSVVADSYNIYDFVDTIGSEFRDRILERDGVFVVRPDSITGRHKTPEELVCALLELLYSSFGGTKTSKGYMVLDPHVRLLWGDGIEEAGINAILDRMAGNGWSVENIVFGMGGGLLQKHNRDTQRFAFKCSAQKRNGTWYDVQKDPLDSSKKSKAGKQKLVRVPCGSTQTFKTVQQDDLAFINVPDELVTVFENGEMKNVQIFSEIRERAALRS